jgi:methylthioribose-1-phosphate isomerase
MQGLEDLGEADRVKIYNPAFDVTPAANITAIIIESGIIENPNKRNIANHLRL